MREKYELQSIEETLAAGLAILPEQAWILACQVAPLINNRVELEPILFRLNQSDPVIASVIEEFYPKLRVLNAYSLDIEEEFKATYLQRIKEFHYEKKKSLISVE